VLNPLWIQEIDAAGNHHIGMVNVAGRRHQHGLKRRNEKRKDTDNFLSRYGES
jgi:hypothetical protein